MNAYTVEYRMHESGNVNKLSFLAKNKDDAYNRAYYTYIPEKHGKKPFNVLVTSVTYQNGNYKRLKGEINK